MKVFFTQPRKSEETLLPRRILLQLLLAAGIPMNERELALMLRAFGVHPRQQRVGRNRFRGYWRADLKGIVERYLSTPPNLPVTSVTSELTALKSVDYGVTDGENHPSHSETPVTRQLIDVKGDIARVTDVTDELRGLVTDELCTDQLTSPLKSTDSPDRGIKADPRRAERYAAPDLIDSIENMRNSAINFLNRIGARLLGGGAACWGQAFWAAPMPRRTARSSQPLALSY